MPLGSLLGAFGVLLGTLGAVGAFRALLGSPWPLLGALGCPFPWPPLAPETLDFPSVSGSKFRICVASTFLTCIFITCDNFMLILLE